MMGSRRKKISSRSDDDDDDDDDDGISPFVAVEVQPLSP